MDQSMKLLFAFCFTIFFFTACGKKDSNNTVRAGKPAAVDKSKSKDQRPVVDQSKLTSEEKKKADADAAERVQLMGMLNEAHGIFTNAYIYSWDPDTVQAPNSNPFNGTLQILMNAYRDDGQELVIAANAECKTAKYEVLKQENLYILNVISCKDLTKKARYAVIQRGATGLEGRTSWFLTVAQDPNAPKIFAHAVGRSLSCTVEGATEANCKIKDVKCQFLGTGKKVSETLKCQNLGQDKDKTSAEYMLWSEFSYSRQSPEHVKITGQKFLSLGKENGSKFEGKDAPTTGFFTITPIGTEGGPEVKKTSTPEPTDAGLASGNDSGNPPASEGAVGSSGATTPPDSNSAQTPPASSSSAPAQASPVPAPGDSAASSSNVNPQQAEASTSTMADKKLQSETAPDVNTPSVRGGQVIPGSL